jgi:hypothetical protein
MDTPLILAIAAGSLTAAMTFTMLAVYITCGDGSYRVDDPWLEEKTA